jgi:hypothetical protein
LVQGGAALIQSQPNDSEATPITKLRPQHKHTQTTTTSKSTIGPKLVFKELTRSIGLKEKVKGMISVEYLAAFNGCVVI